VNLGSGLMMIQLTKTQRGNIIICTNKRCLLPLFNVWRQCTKRPRKELK